MWIEIQQEKKDGGTDRKGVEETRRLGAERLECAQVKSRRVTEWKRTCSKERAGGQKSSNEKKTVWMIIVRRTRWQINSVVSLYCEGHFCTELSIGDLLNIVHKEGSVPHTQLAPSPASCVLLLLVEMWRHLITGMLCFFVEISFTLLLVLLDRKLSYFLYLLESRNSTGKKKSQDNGKGRERWGWEEPCMIFKVPW